MDELFYGGPVEASITTMVSKPILKDRLTLAIQQAEKKLQDVKRAKEIFDKNPELEELLNIMQHGNF